MRNKNKNIMLDLEKITLKVREIALRAGAFLRKERSGFDRSKVEKKNAHDYKPQNKMFHFCKTFCSKITLVNTIQNVI